MEYLRELRMAKPAKNASNFMENTYNPNTPKIHRERKKFGDKINMAHIIVTIAMIIVPARFAREARGGLTLFVVPLLIIMSVIYYTKYINF